MQESGERSCADIRHGSRSASVWIQFDEVSRWAGSDAIGMSSLRLSLGEGQGGTLDLSVTAAGGGKLDRGLLPAKDPDHFVVPYLAKRKVMTYSEDIRRQNLLTVSPNLAFLSSKLATVAAPGFSGHEWYMKACNDLLGFPVVAIQSDNGMRPGVHFSDGSSQYLDQMGEGVANIAGLLAALSVSKDKLFLIEEPENDLHPQALKALLDLIMESSKVNQFVISTHSNIVLRHLGGEPDCKVYNIKTEVPGESIAHLVETESSARLEVLRDLGYTLSDFDLWGGWLILEEASAETIIREYLIPWFAPKLMRVRTLAVNGVSNIEPAFDDFHRLVRFAHLEDAYKGSTWVRVDGDHDGRKVVQRLRERYTSWPADRFDTFTQGQFELYYPGQFSAEAKDVLAIDRKAERRESKRNLLLKVLAWIDEDHERAKEALRVSACDVIANLRTMEDTFSMTFESPRESWRLVGLS